MYVHKVVTKTKNGKVSHTCYLPKHSYRKNGKHYKKTIANLSDFPLETIEAIKLALKNKGSLEKLTDVEKDVTIQQGKRVGAVYVLYQLTKEMGIEKALGYTREGKLALWQVIARLIDQGSRLSAVRLARSHTCCDILKIKKSFNEDHLYKNLH